MHTLKAWSKRDWRKKDRNSMNKNLIQKLLGDRETRMLIANDFASALQDAMSKPELFVFDEVMCSVLNKLNDIPLEGDMITIEVSDQMWVRGEYVHTRTDGKVAVVSQTPPKIYAGKRVDLVIKSEEGK